MLTTLRISRPQLVDLAILVGTDFGGGVKGTGPEKALKLVREDRAIDRMPEEIRAPVMSHLERIRTIYLKPDVMDDYRLEPREPDVSGVLHFLCDQREFSKARVTAALERASRAVARTPCIRVCPAPPRHREGVIRWRRSRRGRLAL